MKFWQLVNNADGECAAYIHRTYKGALANVLNIDLGFGEDEEQDDDQLETRNKIRALLESQAKPTEFFFALMSGDWELTEEEVLA